MPALLHLVLVNGKLLKGGGRYFKKGLLFGRKCYFG
jgi:hypothetical protein